MDMERRLPCCLKTWLRCGVEKNLGCGWEDDHRWCFRLVRRRPCLRVGHKFWFSTVVNTDQKLIYLRTRSVKLQICYAARDDRSSVSGPEDAVV